MVRETHVQWKVGDRVVVPWGVDDEVEGRVVEVWGDPPAHVRVAIEFDDDEPPEVLLLNPRILSRPRRV